MQELQDFLTTGDVISCEETREGVVITREPHSVIPVGDIDPPRKCFIAGVTASDFHFEA